MSNVSQRLDLRQSQSLVMTPQLQQAIKLLQLNNVELAEFIEEELAQNPLLEKADPNEGNDSNSDDSSVETDDNSDHMQDEFDNSWTGNESETPQKDQSDFDAGSSAASTGSGGSHSFEDIEDSFENRMSKPETLRDHLLEQLHVKFTDNRDRMIGALLIDSLDETGYLRQDPTDLAERLGCKEERITRLLSGMRGFDPTGVFARDLTDCLALQLEEQGKLDAPMQRLLTQARRL